MNLGTKSEKFAVIYGGGEMKKVNPVLGMMLIMVLFFASLSFSDQYIVCIDAGHGGRGADKFHNGGDGYGTLGYRDSLSEQWINL